MAQKERHLVLVDFYEITRCPFGAAEGRGVSVLRVDTTWVVVIGPRGNANLIPDHLTQMEAALKSLGFSTEFEWGPGSGGGFVSRNDQGDYIVGGQSGSMGGPIPEELWEVISKDELIAFALATKPADLQ